MKFTAPPEAYDRSVGRYARELAPRFAAVAGLDAWPPGRVLDVGCGPGALAAFLAARVGARSLSAIDPTDTFAAACAERIPGAEIRTGTAEALPWRDGSFQAALSQLVLSFVSDGPRAAGEMARVVRRGGVVAACTWATREFDPARVFWEAARRLDPGAPDDERLPYRTEAALLDLWRGAGLREVRTASVAVEVDYDGTEELCGMYEAGVGPPGQYYLTLSPERRAELCAGVHEALGRPRGGFTLGARALVVVGVK